MCEGGSGPHSLPSLLSECVVLQICIAAVALLSHGLQFYDIYHRRLPPHSFRLCSGVPQGSILGTRICIGNAVDFLQWDLNGPVMRFGSYCCDTDKRHIFDSTSKTSGIDLPQKTFPTVTTVHTQGIMGGLSHKHNSQAMKSPISLSHILWIKKRKIPHM